MSVQNVADLGAAAQVPQPGCTSCTSGEREWLAVDLREGEGTDAVCMAYGRLGDGQIPDAGGPVRAHCDCQTSLGPDDERGSFDQADVAAQWVAMLPQAAEIPEFAVLGPGGQDPGGCGSLLDGNGGHARI